MCMWSVGVHWRWADISLYVFYRLRWRVCQQPPVEHYPDHAPSPHVLQRPHGETEHPISFTSTLHVCHLIVDMQATGEMTVTQRGPASVQSDSEGVGSAALVALVLLPFCCQWQRPIKHSHFGLQENLPCWLSLKKKQNLPWSVGLWT